MFRCLFEVFHSLREEVEVVIQFGPSDEQNFRSALNRTDGPTRVKAALDEICVDDAHASVETDKELISTEIKATIGMEEFDTHVRDGLTREYRRISALGMTSSSLRSSSLV